MVYGDKTMRRKISKFKSLNFLRKGGGWNRGALRIFEKSVKKLRRFCHE